MFFNHKKQSPLDTERVIQFQYIFYAFLSIFANITLDFLEHNRKPAFIYNKENRVYIKKEQKNPKKEFLGILINAIIF